MPDYLGLSKGVTQVVDGCMDLWFLRPIELNFFSAGKDAGFFKGEWQGGSLAKGGGGAAWQRAGGGQLWS